MKQDDTAFYAAYAARDNRFDGVFYIGVTSTGIYCRPVCTAKTPRRENCRFFANAEAAEAARFRPCLRCRPELAPGNAPIDDAQRVATLLAHRIDEGMVTAESGPWMERVARQFGWSSRQIRRIVQRQLGVTPMQLVQTRRLLLAKQLLTDTRLPISEIAHASGFASLRRFNDAFLTHYRMSPTRFRSRAATGDATPDTLRVRLGYRTPFDWESILAFLRLRQMRGVELLTETSYARSVQLGTRQGWIEVTNDAEHSCLDVTVARELAPVLPALLGRVRNLFDLAARPDVIAAQLSRDTLMRPMVEKHPGLRVPGAFDGFELAVRAILGQQVSVKSATTLAGRFIEAFGVPVVGAREGLTHLSPAPGVVSRLRPAALTNLGIVETRARAIIAMAKRFEEGLTLEPDANPEEVSAGLVAIPGVGPWTASYIAMRALRWPDAFLPGDVAIRKALGGAGIAEAEAQSQLWRPWRSYATLHLWKSQG